MRSVNAYKSMMYHILRMTLFCHDFIFYTLETKKEVDLFTSKMTSVYDIKIFHGHNEHGENFEKKLCSPFFHHFLENPRAYCR